MNGIAHPTNLSQDCRKLPINDIRVVWTPTHIPRPARIKRISRSLRVIFLGLRDQPANVRRAFAGVEQVEVGAIGRGRKLLTRLCRKFGQQRFNTLSIGTVVKSIHQQFSECQVDSTLNALRLTPHLYPTVDEPSDRLDQIPICGIDTFHRWLPNVYFSQRQFRLVYRRMEIRARILPSPPAVKADLHVIPHNSAVIREYGCHVLLRTDDSQAILGGFNPASKDLNVLLELIHRHLGIAGRTVLPVSGS